MRSIVPGYLASAAALTFAEVAPVTGVPKPGPPAPGGGAPPCCAMPGGGAPAAPATDALLGFPFEAMADAPKAIAASAAMPAAALRMDCLLGGLPFSFMAIKVAPRAGAAARAR